jgi:hypothetical protein
MDHKTPSKTAPTKKMPAVPNSDGKNEGEGNRSADRQYRENVSRHVKSGDSEKAAEDARRALEGDEADNLRAAEREGKAGSPQERRPGDGRLEDQRAREDQGQRNQGR